MPKELHGTAAIVTTAASEETQQIHDRMPVILEKPDFPRWLASQSLTKEEAENSLGHLKLVRWWPGRSVAESITPAMTMLA
jgi:putative SOS response-associated peptidase YedK